MISPNLDQKGTIAIVQISRIGDVIQTLQSAIELKNHYPNIKLILIAREKFAKGLEFKLKEAFSEIYYLNYKQLLICDSEQNLDKVRDNLRKFVARINNNDIDVLMNLTYSNSSAYLSSLINSKFKVGLVKNEQNQTVINDNWSQFIYSNTMNGPYSPFNLVDVFKGILGAKGNSYTNGHKNLKNKKIIIHPFASQKKKRWALGKWAEVIYQTLKNHPKATITVMGGPGEIEHANELMSNIILKKFQNRIQNIVGQTSLQELYQEFKTASLFIGHDSMGGHFASLYNVQSLTISLGTVRPFETSPYGAFNYNLSPRISCFPCFVADACETLPCHKDISYNVITEVVHQILQNQVVDRKMLTENVPANFIDKVDLYESSVDAVTGMHLENILHEENTTLDIFRSFYRVLWSFILSDVEVTLPFPKLSKRKTQILERHLDGIQHFHELCHFGKTYTKYIFDEASQVSPNVSKIKDYSEKINEVDRLGSQLKESYPHITPLVDYYHVSKANIPGITIKELAECSYINYQEAQDATKVLLELVESTLKKSPHYKPRTNKIDKQTSPDN